VLAEALSPEKVHISGFRLRSGHWAVGKSLEDLELRPRTGASILQIKRGSVRIPSPSPATRLEADDDVLVIGESEQIRRAELLFESGIED